MSRFTQETDTKPASYPQELFINYTHDPTVTLEQTIIEAMGKAWFHSTWPEVSEVSKESLYIDYQNKHGLTTDEACAITFYTLETTPVSLYRELNTGLSKRSLERKWYPYMWILMSALNKLPSKKDTVYRALDKRVGSSNLYKKESEIVYVTFTSTTTEKEQIQQFLKGKGTLFLLKVTEGKDVSFFSKFKKEKEVLLCPNIRFTVYPMSSDFQELISLTTPTYDYFVLKQVKSSKTKKQHVDSTSSFQKSGSKTQSKSKTTITTTNTTTTTTTTTITTTTTTTAASSTTSPSKKISKSDSKTTVVSPSSTSTNSRPNSSSTNTKPDDSEVTTVSPPPPSNSDFSKINPFDACFKGNLQDLKLWHENGQESVNIHNKDRDGEPSLLYTAARAGHPQLVQYLLQQNADPNKGHAVSSMSTPLHGAIQGLNDAKGNRIEDFIKVYKLLLESNADLNAKNKYGEIPIDNAASVEHKSLLISINNEMEAAKVSVVNTLETAVYIPSKSLSLSDDDHPIPPQVAVSIIQNQRLDKTWINQIFSTASSEFKKHQQQTTLTEWEYISLYTLVSKLPSHLTIMDIIDEDIKGKRHLWRFFVSHIIGGLKKLPKIEVVGYCEGGKIINPKQGGLLVVSGFLHLVTNAEFKNSKKNVYQISCFSARRLSDVIPSIPTDEVLCHPESQFQFVSVSPSGCVLEQQKSKDPFNLEG